MSVPASVVLALAELGAEVARGQVPAAAELAKRLVGLGLELVPVEELRQHLDAEAAARVDALVDAVVDQVKGPA